MGPGQDGGQRASQYASIKCSCNTIKGAQSSFLLILQQNRTYKLRTPSETTVIYCKRVPCYKPKRAIVGVI